MNRKTFREATVKLLRRILSPLLEYGLISRDEFDLLFAYISSLAQKGVPPEPIPRKMLTGKEVAELLSISYSEFRKLESAGEFSFRRRNIGKNVRYYYPEIVEYMRSGGLDDDKKKHGGDTE